VAVPSLPGAGPPILPVRGRLDIFDVRVIIASGAGGVNQGPDFRFMVAVLTFSYLPLNLEPLVNTETKNPHL
jgi:hypothetical protein